MMIQVLKSKIHCVTVTEANLNYMGSITVDEDLLDAANMIAGEKVQIVDNNNGERFETYIIKGERGSGCICLKGAAARKVQEGDVVIIMSYALLDFAFPIEKKTKKNQNTMKSLNRNGVRLTQAPGEKKFVNSRPFAFKGRIFYEYDYRHTDGELFSTVAKTLAECRHRRDKWIEKNRVITDKF